MAQMPLADVLAQLREQLAEAERKAAGKDLKLTVKEIEVELQVLTTMEGKVGFKVWLHGTQALQRVAAGRIDIDQDDIGRETGHGPQQIVLRRDAGHQPEALGSQRGCQHLAPLRPGIDEHDVDRFDQGFIVHGHLE